jgi:L-aspartate oxidase
MYAAGEVASTGVHGANRLAGNSLSESLVFGARSAAALAAELPARVGDIGPAPVVAQEPASEDLAKLRHELRTAMLRDAGPVRDGASLTALTGWLADLEERLGTPSALPEEVELHHAVRAARLITWGAGLRTESRGGHWREDHPAKDPAWAGVHLERTGLVGTP